MWRGEDKPGITLSKLYSTCTPDSRTCPDGVCDSLEDLYYGICPQDCADLGMITLQLTIRFLYILRI